MQAHMETEFQGQPESSFDEITEGAGQEREAMIEPLLEEPEGEVSNLDCDVSRRACETRRRYKRISSKRSNAEMAQPRLVENAVTSLRLSMGLHLGSNSGSGEAGVDFKCAAVAVWCGDSIEVATVLDVTGASPDALAASPRGHQDMQLLNDGWINANLVMAAKRGSDKACLWRSERGD